ncbi:hypothetical protein ACNKFW_02015 [Paracoccus sp. TD-10]|uniref:hypothetical protein n=1 Tax=Paracoccus sp. TD-10 TaxID=3395918 RepID=UPI003AAB0930
MFFKSHRSVGVEFIWRIIISAFLLFSSFSSALAECAEFVRPPLTFDRPNWSDLERFTAEGSLNSAIEKVQSLDGDGQGKLNIDQYSIVIDAAGQSAGQLFDEFRANLGEIIFGPSGNRDFYPFSDGDANTWNSNSPKGAVMVFRLETMLSGEIPLERGAVVLSCKSETDFIFSTVKVGSSVFPNGPGWHPVSGNRAFGVRDNGDGSLTIFVKAADRVADVSLFQSVVGSKTIFEGGHQVWLKMLDNIQKRYSARNPRDRAVFSVRVDY